MSPNEKVRVLLDVDGVLNADTRQPGACWPDWRVDRVIGCHVTWSPSVAKFIVALNSRGVEIVWLTTWGRRANDPLGLMMGLPEFRVAGEYRVDEEWWKLGLAQELYGTDQRPFVWIDDDLVFEEKAVEWLMSLPDGRVLAVSPGREEGINPGHIKRIWTFVDRVLGGVATA